MMISKYKYFVFFICIYLLSNAQTLQKGNQLIFIGVGENATLNYIIKNNISEVITFHRGNNESYKVKSTPNIFLKYEKMVAEKVGFGFNINYRSTSIQQKYNYSVPTNSFLVVNNYHYQIYETIDEQITYSFQNFSIAARCSYHFLDFEKFHPYATVGLGYRFSEGGYSIKSTAQTKPDYGITFEKAFPLFCTATVGANYMLSKKLGLYAELGIDKMSIIQGGLCFNIDNGTK